MAAIAPKTAGIIEIWLGVHTQFPKTGVPSQAPIQAITNSNQYPPAVLTFSANHHIKEITTAMMVNHSQDKNGKYTN